LALLLQMPHFLRVPDRSAGSGSGRSDKMRDEIDSRIWVEHGAGFSAFLAGALTSVKVSRKRLHEIAFDAPWRHPKLGR
jgi:hypothetical protein